MNSGRQTECKPGDVDHGKHPVSLQVTPGDFEMVFNHCLCAIGSFQFMDFICVEESFDFQIDLKWLLFNG